MRDFSREEINISTVMVRYNVKGEANLSNDKLKIDCKLGYRDRRRQRHCEVKNKNVIKEGRKER